MNNAGPCEPKDERPDNLGGGGFDGRSSSNGNEIVLSDWSAVSADKVEFILDEARVYLSHLGKKHTELLNRIQLLLTFYFAAIALLLGSEINGTNFHSTFRFTALIVLSVLALFAVCRLFIPGEYQGEGSRPSDMLIPDYVGVGLPLMKQGFLFELQRRIEVCRLRNDQLYAEYKRMLKLTCAALVFLVVLFSLIWAIIPFVLTGSW